MQQQPTAVRKASMMAGTSLLGGGIFKEHRGLVLVSPIHYLKNIYLYSIDNGLMDKHAEELEEMDLPFKWQYIPLDYPQPEFYI